MRDKRFQSPRGQLITRRRDTIHSSSVSHMNTKHSFTRIIRALALCALAAFALNTARGATTRFWDGSTVNTNGASDNTPTGGLTWLGTGSGAGNWDNGTVDGPIATGSWATRSEEHTSELQSLRHLVCRLL